MQMGMAPRRDEKLATDKTGKKCWRRKGKGF